MKFGPITGLSRSFLSALALAGTLTASPALTVQPGSGPGATTVTDVVYDNSYPKWLVADLTDPVNPDYINVITSDTAGAWVLNLDFDPGASDLVTGSTFDIEQLLTLDPSSASLTGWRQEILTADWEWDSVTVFDYDSALPVAGLSTSGAGTGLVTSVFDPLTSPANLSIVGTLRYTGAGGPAAGPGISITPVPEPGATAVMVMAAASLVLLRRRAAAPHA
jgi:hypothetical protein